MKNLKPKSIIIFALIFLSIALMFILLMKEAGNINEHQKNIYLQISSFCGLLLFTFGIALSIRNKIKAGKKVRFIQNFALVYFGVGALMVLVSIILLLLEI